MVVILPALLLLVISVGYSVHIFSFFNQEFEKTGDRKLAIEHALEHAAWPILFTVITTGFGFLSFLMVPITAVRWIGVTSAALAVTSYPLVVILTPALLSFGSNRKKMAGEDKQRSIFIEYGLVKFGRWVLRNGKLVVGLSVLVTGIFMAFLSDIEVNTDILRSEGLRVPYVKRIFKVANDIGSFYSFDCAISLPEDGMAKDPEVLKKLDDLAEEIEKASIIKRTRSVTEIIKDLNMTINGSDKNLYRIPDDKDTVAQLMLLYEMSGGSGQEDWVDYDYKNLRLSIELKNFDAAQVRKQLDLLEVLIPKLFPGAKMLLTGTVVTFSKMIDYMITGQLKSIAVALITIGLVMMIIFGSIKLGLIGMIPNIIPLIFVGGTMGLLDIPLHLMSIMVAPMIIGIAVDDTIHYINHFRVAYWKTGSIKISNVDTFRSVGKAIFLTSVIIILGFAAFGTSASASYVHIAILTAVSVLSALLADYLVTPNLIRWTDPFKK
jgi:predicted RND superfamily exporter protein